MKNFNITNIAIFNGFVITFFISLALLILVLIIGLLISINTLSFEVFTYIFFILKNNYGKLLIMYTIFGLFFSILHIHTERDC
jgi:hypothetical protein